MASFKFNLNGKTIQLDNVDPDMPLLWALRENLGLTGTKFGCGIAQCGVCTVHLDGNAIKSCVLPVAAVENKEVTTIEGLSENNDHPVQQAWIEEQVPQCGYCQSGQIMAAAALLKNNPTASETEVEAAMQAVYCRCGTYPRIKKALAKLVKS
ncbi:(2Fe-2S)-binding protein [Chondrinema litorale]|uniref:(2Fe-2S)-binding protein n=1 Tax=Chondrinema litorale TaxID=2994555 RepID=UPI002542D90A|nr:(2Fe-2S)-binding protein [Chondrinema litorale]UZR97042.1 (2Fe-2S)-binding protein [Chondrinema litorale]